MDDTIQILAAVLALITTPACIYLTKQVAVLYKDLGEARREMLELQRETLEVMRSLRVNGKPHREGPA